MAGDKGKGGRDKLGKRETGGVGLKRGGWGFLLLSFREMNLRR